MQEPCIEAPLCKRAELLMRLEPGLLVPGAGNWLEHGEDVTASCLLRLVALSLRSCLKAKVSVTAPFRAAHVRCPVCVILASSLAVPEKTLADV